MPELTSRAVRSVLYLSLAAHCLASVPAAAELRAGVAQADITPPLGSQLYGYGARGNAVSTAVHDPLHATTALLVSAVIGDFPFASRLMTAAVVVPSSPS